MQRKETKRKHAPDSATSPFASRLGHGDGPPGGKESAHQIINTGTTELKYLAVSTKMPPEIAEYPDSGKFGILAEYPAGPDADSHAGSVSLDAKASA